MLMIIWFFIIAVVLIVGGIVLCQTIGDYDEGTVIPIILGSILMVIALGCLAQYHTRSVKADLINKKFGTNYTYEEVFWGGGIIQKMLEGDLIRAEISVEQKDN